MCFPVTKAQVCPSGEADWATGGSARALNGFLVSTHVTFKGEECRRTVALAIRNARPIWVPNTSRGRLTMRRRIRGERKGKNGSSLAWKDKEGLGGGVDAVVATGGSSYLGSGAGMMRKWYWAKRRAALS